MPRLRLSHIISLLLVIAITVVAGVAVANSGQSLVVFQVSQPEYRLVKPAPLPSIIQPELAAQTIYASPTGVWQDISSQAVLVIDVPSATTLLQKNPELEVSPASTTKMLTALVALDTYSTGDVFTVKEEAFTVGTRLELKLQEQFNVRELLFGLLLQSSNDAAFVLANNHPQGYAGFVKAMNQKAETLQLEQSHFTNPSGLDTDGHTSSVRDLSILARELLKNEMLKTIVGTKKYIMTDVTGVSQYQLTNTHQLIHSIPEVKGIKTGTTERAGEVLVTYVEKENRQVVIMVAGSKDRYLDTKTIIEWIFTNYQWQEIVGTQ